MPVSLLIRVATYSALWQSSLIRPIWVVFLTSRGLSLAALGSAEALYHFGGLLAELPTGWLADRWRTAHVLALGCVITAAALQLMQHASAFSSILVAMTLWGAGSAFHSGALEAWLFRQLDASGMSAAYAQVYGRLSAIGLVAAAAASALGGWIAQQQQDYVSLFYAQTGLLFAAAVLALSLSDRTSRRVAGRLQADPREAAAAPPLSLRILAFLGLRGFLESTSTFSGIFAMPYLQMQTNSTLVLGLSVAAANLAAMAGAASAGGLGRILPRRALCMGLIACLGASLIAFALLPSPVNILAFALRSYFDWMLMPLLSAEANERIGEPHRATLLSVTGFTIALLSMAGFPLGGAAATVLGLPLVFVIIGFAEIAALLAYAWLVPASAGEADDRR